MKRHHRTFLYSLLLLALLSSGITPPANAQPPQDYSYVVQALQASAYPICPGDQVSIYATVFGAQSGIPLPYGTLQVIQSDPIAGRVDNPMPTVAGGTASFTYTASDQFPSNNTRVDLLTFIVAGTPTLGSVPVTIFACKDYEVDFLARQKMVMPGLEAYWYFSGEGKMQRESGELSGAGSDEIYFSLKGAEAEVSCSLDPVLFAEGSFTAQGKIAPLAPGTEMLDLDLDFEPVNPGEGNMKCVAPDTQVNVPFPVGQWDPNEAGLRDMPIIMQNNTGRYNFTLADATGRLTVRRQVLP